MVLVDDNGLLVSMARDVKAFVPNDHISDLGAKQGKAKHKVGHRSRVPSRLGPGVVLFGAGEGFFAMQPVAALGGWRGHHSAEGGRISQETRQSWVYSFCFLVFLSW